MNYIFLTGRASLKTITLIFRDVFDAVNFTAESSKFDHKLPGNLKVRVDCNANQGDIDFDNYKQKVKDFKLDSLKAIIFLDDSNNQDGSFKIIKDMLKSDLILNTLNAKTYFIHGLNSLEVKIKVNALIQTNDSYFDKVEDKTSSLQFGSNFFVWFLVITLTVGFTLYSNKNSNSCINQNPAAILEIQVTTNEAELELK